MKEKTICALATPLGRGSISVIRISGKDSLKIAKEFFSSKNLDYNKIEPRKMYLGKFKLEQNFEKCLMVFFKAPFSYTGEEMIEFHIHGGEFLTEKILSIILTKCSLAEPGEFSKRAFFNGKISLDEAEGIIDLINAESDAEINSASLLMNGKLCNEIVKCQNELTEMIAKIEVALDYPDYDMELEIIFETKQKLIEIENVLKSILDSSDETGKIKSGVNVAIVGSPNVGKSSLLNALIGEERAIVTNVEGTTRDVLKETIIYNGIKINFIDTAGIRQCDNIVESIGIERAKKEINKADIVLFVIDLSRKMTIEEIKFFESLKNKNYILIANKKDIKKEILEYKDIIEISASKNENIEKIKYEIFNRTIKEKIDFSNIVLTNKRHIEVIKNTLNLVYSLVNSENQMLDIFAFEIKNIWNELGKITGTTENEEIIDEIFSKFCLGK